MLEVAKGRHCYKDVSCGARESNGRPEKGEMSIDVVVLNIAKQECVND